MTRDCIDKTRGGSAGPRALVWPGTLAVSQSARCPCAAKPPAWLAKPLVGHLHPVPLLNHTFALPQAPSCPSVHSTVTNLCLISPSLRRCLANACSSRSRFAGLFLTPLPPAALQTSHRSCLDKFMKTWEALGCYHKRLGRKVNQEIAIHFLHSTV